jgi:hypothetical protein
MMKDSKSVPRAIDAPLYRYWQALYMSFYSRRLYVDVCLRWRGFGLMYLFCLMSLLVIPLSVHTLVDFNHYVHETLIFPFKAMPPLVIEQGRLKFDKPIPYVIKNKQGVVVGMIDTTGKAMRSSQVFPHLVVLATERALYVHIPPIKTLSSTMPSPLNNELYTESFEPLGSVTLQGEKWFSASGLLSMTRYMYLFIYPMLLSLFYGFYLGLALFFTLFAQAFSWIAFRVKLPFKSAARLVIVSSTPHLSLFLLLLATNQLFPGVGMVCGVIGMGYFSMAMLTIKRESQRLVHV